MSPKDGSGPKAAAERARTTELLRMLTIEEVAEYLQLSPSFVRLNWEKLGMPMAKIGNRVRIRVEDLEAWVQAQVH
jgi:excisionase family DNA binding protein